MNAKPMSQAAVRVLELAATDPQLQALMPDPVVTSALRTKGISYEQAIATALDGYADRPALGQRAVSIVVDPATGRARRELLTRFDTITYAELHHRVKGLASTWRADPVHRVEPGEFVCLLGFTGIDYVVAELACAYVRGVSVPLQSTLAGTDLDRILTDTEPVSLVATTTDLVLAAQLAVRHESVRGIVVMDLDPRVDDDREHYDEARAILAAADRPVGLAPIDELCASGAERGWEFLPPLSDHGERMALLLHSSGSTGTPKGAIMLERHVRPGFAVSAAPPPTVRLVFAPMNHGLGRIQAFSTLARGGTAYFTARPDMSTLLEDFRLVRPTEALMFPRVMEMIHRHYLTEVARRTSRGEDEQSARAQVQAEMRPTFLGDRLTAITAGSAPTTPEVRQFMIDCFAAGFSDGYGSTEAGAPITVQGRIMRPPVIDYRLRDVPELGYFTTDKPYPRGELCVKTTTSVPGYFKRPDLNAQLFDEDGFVLTGDIMEERGPDHVVFIDRRNDVLKLSQGEYVPIGQLGVTFEGGSDVIHQIYVYGNSARSHLLAVVVPDPDVAAARLGSDVSDAALRTLIREELRRVGDEERLKSFEIPRDFIIEHEPFSHENGLLSSVQKRMRPALQRRYGDRLEALYEELDRRQHDELAALRDPGTGLGTVERIVKALEASLGVEGIDPGTTSGFAELGGDSLGAVAFTSLLSDIFGVDLAVNTILSPAGNPQSWARAIERAQAEQSEMPTFARIHGPDAHEIDILDLDLDRFLPTAVQEGAPRPPLSPPFRRVLLTGATGFLGRFLALALLEDAAQTGGRVTCLVRAADQSAARARLHEAFDGDSALAARFEELAADHLEVVVGDVAEPRLGLRDDEHARLAHEVDRIVHPAALVNHMLGYEDLFAPNVAGTAELIALALTERIKPVDFVSSLAVATLIDRRDGITERAPLVARVALSGAYGSGYAASKWAAEQLLRQAHERYGLPVNVFRADMILAHSSYRGQINVPDVFTRLLLSVVRSGLAPRSFYRLDADGSRPSAHYDGLPVDFIAAALTALGAEAHDELRTYHVTNHHHDDGMSLDAFVDVIESEGYLVERVDDHATWVERFERKLKRLPDEERQRSSLGVLDSLRRPADPRASQVDSTRFIDSVRALAAVGDVPHLDRAFIRKCLSDLRELGLIPPPPEA